MQKHVRIFSSLLIFMAGILSLSVSTANTKNNLAKKFLPDSIEAALSDTSFVLSLPLVITLDTVPVVPADLVRDRLSCLQSSIPLHYNQYVQGFVNYFTIRNRRYTRRILERENVYFPLFEKYLAKHNLPDELKYLSVVESALNPKAMSWAKAVGLWQFMSPTAGDFNLKMNDYVDERMDPEKSTEAACKFLKQLYRMFGDWELVMAAYNCGPGNVRKVIARSGGKKTFWEIFPYLPKETRSYVPSFTAVVYTMNHTLEHDLTPDTLLYAVETDTVLINQSLDLKKFALQLNLPEDEITKLNPAIKKAYLPASVRNFPVKVPVQKRELLAVNRAAILDSCRMPILIQPLPTPAVATMVASAPAVKKEETLPAPTTSDSAATDSLQKTEYVVAKGDFLQKIAQKHQVTIAQIKEWNNIQNPNIKVGQKLTLFLTGNLSTTEMQPEAAPVTEETPKKTTSLASSKVSRQSARATKMLEEVKQIHAVQPGDTLWNISKRLNVPVDQIRKLNKLKNDEIKPGQKLILS